MKILWLCNIVIPQVAEKINIPSVNTGGWIQGIAGFFDGNDKFDLHILAPTENECHVEWGHGSHFWGFVDNKNICKYDKEVEKNFTKIINDINPDIVQIFGTEFPHCLEMVNAFSKPERTVIHIQGIVSEYAKHYYAYLPLGVVVSFSLRDLIKFDNIWLQKKKFEKRGMFENEAIEKVENFLCRTEWDCTCVRHINPKAHFFFVQESMRTVFYEDEWDYESCEKHTIFVSQAAYPIKGFHILIEAMNVLKKEFADVKLYVAGNNIFKFDGMKRKIRRTYYAKYINKLIKKYGLGNNICFVGNQNSNGMKTYLLKTNVFVLPSSIENSPNSLGEAMLLGTPIIASYVGGVPSLVTNEKNGLLYPADSVSMLARSISKVFNDKEYTIEISNVEKKVSKDEYERDKICEAMVKTYFTIDTEAKDV